jgi:hypothetical protein
MAECTPGLNLPRQLFRRQRAFKPELATVRRGKKVCTIEGAEIDFVELTRLLPRHKAMNRVFRATRYR